MATIITRETGVYSKDSELTNAELDANFININTELEDSKSIIVVPTCVNNTGLTIVKGTLVMLIGIDADKLSIAPAITTGAMSLDLVLGVAGEDIYTATDSDLVVLKGVIQEINTGSWAEGARIYADYQNAGQLTDVKPSSPNLETLIGYVLRAGTTGWLYIKL